MIRAWCISVVDVVASPYDFGRKYSAIPVVDRVSIVYGIEAKSKSGF